MAKRMAKKLYESELMVLQAKLGRHAGVGAGHPAPASSSSSRAGCRGQGLDDQTRVGVPEPARHARSSRCRRPSERDKTRWYFQRYVPHLPAAGEIVLMDRSWYNRAGVEHVMGYCTSEEYHRFLHQTPIFERLLVEDGIILLKYWFSVSDEVQEERFHSRLPTRCGDGS